MPMNDFIRISKWAKEILDEFKKVEEHTSYDSVIRSLIHRSLKSSYKNVLKKSIRDQQRER